MLSRMVPRLAAVARGPTRASLQRTADCVGRIVAVPFEVRGTLMMLAIARREYTTLTSFQRPRFALVWRRLAPSNALFVRSMLLCFCSIRCCHRVLLPRCFVLQARWTTSAAGGTALDSAPAKTSSSTLPTAVLLQLGGSSFRPIENVLDKNMTTLLDLIAGNKALATDLKLGDCIVEVTVSVDDEPAADAKWQPLKGITTMAKLWEQRASAGAFLHVRVRLPSASAAAAAATPGA